MKVRREGKPGSGVARGRMCEGGREGGRVSLSVREGEAECTQDSAQTHTDSTHSPRRKTWVETLMGWKRKKKGEIEKGIKERHTRDSLAVNPSYRPLSSPICVDTAQTSGLFTSLSL